MEKAQRSKKLVKEVLKRTQGPRGTEDRTRRKFLSGKSDDHCSGVKGEKKRVPRPYHRLEKKAGKSMYGKPITEGDAPVQRNSGIDELKNEGKGGGRKGSCVELLIVFERELEKEESRSKEEGG